MKLRSLKRAALSVALSGFLAAAGGFPGIAAAAGTPSFGLIYKQDFLHDVFGGKERVGAAPGMLQFNAGFKQDDNIFKAAVLGTFGSSMYKQIGVIQAPSALKAYNTVKLYELWWGHRFGNSGLALRLGLQRYATLFNTLFASKLFINSSFRVPPTIYQAHPSIYPVTALGAVAHWQARNGLYVVGGIYDGTPGLPGHPAGTHIELRRGDGAFSDFEIGFSHTKLYKVGIGGWYRSTDYKDVAGRPHDSNHGVYLIGSSRLIGGSDQPTLNGFVEFGNAESDRNKFGSFIGAGFKLSHFMPGRPHDVLGLGMARVLPTDLYRRVNAVHGTAETTYELTYLLALTKHLFLQPDAQYVVNPGASLQVANAWVVGFRLEYKY